ncbi:MAG TPA: MerR family transcriptional regulator [Phnomibacter sp.]|nr:MerR family transcriptional regulator [Phnomibacter sp.]
MIGKQLDLFGAPLLPPKNIIVEDEPSAKKAPPPQEEDHAADPIEDELELENAVEEPEEEGTIHVQMPASSSTVTSAMEDMAANRNVSASMEEDDTEVAVANKHEEETAPSKDGTLNIPNDQLLYSRQYYTMRETAAMFNVNQSLLRFWENEFDILKPKKNRKGDRYFRPEDIKNLELIYHLLKVRRFTIGGAKEYMKNRSKTLDTFEMVQRLEKIKQFLLELKAHY